MSRIAKNTIKISKETSCTFEKGIFLAKGKLGEMSVSVNSNFEIKINLILCDNICTLFT